MNVDAVLSGLAGPAGVRRVLRGRLSRGALRDALSSQLAWPQELGPCRPRRARLYEAMFLLKLAAHRAPVHHSAWPGLTSSFVAQAEAILGELRQR